jgi:hypothetical protein
MLLSLVCAATGFKVDMLLRIVYLKIVYRMTITEGQLMIKLVIDDDSLDNRRMTVR